MSVTESNQSESCSFLTGLGKLFIDVFMNKLSWLVLVVTVFLGSVAQHPQDRACADFNRPLYEAVQSGVNYFQCPADGIANVACQEGYAIRSGDSDVQTPASLEQAQVKLNEVVIYVLLGPASKVDAFKWWLPLITEKMDIVLVLDACEQDGAKLPNSSIDAVHKADDASEGGGGASEERQCDNFVRKMIRELPEKVKKMANFHVVHVRPEDETYQKLSCKVSTAMREIYHAFPEKRYYLKIDTDTIVFPGRLLHFLSSLESVHKGGVTDSQKPSESTHPIYFGTVVESGMDLLLCGSHEAWKTRYGNTRKGGLCYAQGGAGYGLNNHAMAAMAQAPSCTDPKRVTQDEFLANEDAWTGMQMHSLFNISVIHCGGFSSSELAPDRKLRQSITFHYIDTKWLASYGETALKHYHKVYSRQHSQLGG